MMSSNSEKPPNGSHIQVVVSVISLIGVVATSTITNWDKLFPRDSKDDTSIVGTEDIQKEPTLTKVEFNVLTDSYEPIVSAEVKFIFEGAPAPRLTDQNGYVQISVPEREDIEVIVRKEGFQTIRQFLNLKADPDRTITIYVSELDQDDVVGAGDSPSANTISDTPNSERQTQSEPTSSAESIPLGEESLPFFMVRPVVEDDLDGKTMWEMDIMRNEIFARHGRRFNRQDLQNYFDEQSWYKPKYFPDEFPDSLLTSTQKNNAKFILEYQNNR